MAARKPNGQFDVGNRFGIGRPKRSVELEYLQALSDSIPLESWRAVCKRAVEDANAGDDKARAWLAKYLIGDTANLTTLAKLEALGVSPADYVRALADVEIRPGGLNAILEAETEGESTIARAIRFAQEQERPAGQDPSAAKE